MQTNYQKSPTIMLRIDDVMYRLGLPKSSVYEKAKNKEITPPVSIGLRRSAWPSYEIDEINKALISGADSKAIKDLVAKLTAQRQELLPNFTNTLLDICVEEKESTRLRELSPDSFDYRLKKPTHRTPTPNPSIFGEV